MRFGDRHEAGRLLGEELANHDFERSIGALGISPAQLRALASPEQASASTDAKAG